MNRGRNHAAHDGRGDGLHHVRADAGFSQDRNEARQHDGDGHQLGTQPVHGALDDRRLQVGLGERHAGSKTALKRLVQVNHHDDARFDGDAE